MGPKLVLHIGTHKTGSTAIQLSASQEADRLRTEGLLYPDSGRGQHPGHPHLAWEAAGSRQFDPGAGGREALVEEVTQSCPEAVLISSEELTRVPVQRFVEWARALTEALHPASVNVVGYVRPQWEYLESLYSERVKRIRVCDTFCEFVEKNLSDPRLDYNTIFGPWTEAFPGDVVVRPYSTEVVTDFWRTIDLVERPPAPPSARANERIGLKAAEMLRVLSCELQARGFKRPSRASLHETRRRLLNGLAEDSAFKGLTHDAALNIWTQFKDLNQRFAARYLGYDAFAPPAEFPDPPSWSLADATAQEQRAFDTALAALLEDVGSRHPLRRHTAG